LFRFDSEGRVDRSIALGSFTVTMTALPGTPAIQNAIPMPFFGTTPFAAPLLGIIGGSIMFVTGMLWLNHRARNAMANGEGYGDHLEELDDEDEGQALPSFGLAITPILLVIVSNFVFSKYVIPAWNTGYLSEEQYGAVELKAVHM